MIYFNSNGVIGFLQAGIGPHPASQVHCHIEGGKIKLIEYSCGRWGGICFYLCRKQWKKKELMDMRTGSFFINHLDWLLFFFHILVTG